LASTACNDRLPEAGDDGPKPPRPTATVILHAHDGQEVTIPEKTKEKRPPRA
jgi:hypothetical protein